MSWLLFSILLKYGTDHLHIEVKPNMSVGQMQGSTVRPLAHKPCFLLDRKEAGGSQKNQELAEATRSKLALIGLWGQIEV